MSRGRPRIFSSMASTKPLIFIFLTSAGIIDFNAIIVYGDILQTGEATIPMSSITIRNLDPVIKERLRVRAAEHGHSMEAEARRILQTALAGAPRPPVRNLYERVRARFAPLGGVDLQLPEREPARELPPLD
jgi:plasmid stability protein